jgi:hypothetical protein
MPRKGAEKRARLRVPGTYPGTYPREWASLKAVLPPLLEPRHCNQKLLIYNSRSTMPGTYVETSSFASIQAPIFSPKMPAILAFLWPFAGICHSVNFQQRCLAPLLGSAFRSRYSRRECPRSLHSFGHLLAFATP